MTPTLYTVPGVGTVAVVPGYSAQPVLIHLTGAATELAEAGDNGLPTLMHAQGWTVASIDLPAHGDDATPLEQDPPRHLKYWLARMQQGDHFGALWAPRIRTVIAFLAETVPHQRRYAISGLSRGGYLAVWLAALLAELEIVVLLNPVTDLRALIEMGGWTIDAVPPALFKPTYLTIGRDDPRVSTAAALAWAAAIANRTPHPNALELRVTGRVTHTIDPDDEPAAAAWLVRQFAEA